MASNTDTSYIQRLLLSLFTIYLIEIVIVYGSYTPIKIEIPEEEFKTFTDKNIAKYDGSNPDESIYMAVKGVVFDVSTGRNFYGKGAAYNALVGMDASRAVAKMSLEPEDLNRDLTGLSESLLKSLDDIYRDVYKAKYPIVGYMSYLVKEQQARTKQDL